MKVLITGANGQVGYELVRQAESNGIDYCAFTRAELDITDSQAVEQAISNCKPDIIINAAAYTAVDKAEDEPELAFAVNRDGAENLAKACKSADIPMIHISTDYVFDGTKEGAYTEEDLPNPLGVYGQSKWEGEEIIRATLPNHIILRVSWVFGIHGNNFVKTILRLGKDHKELRIVADQRGGPTPADAIAETLLEIAHLVLHESRQLWGTYHYCGTPVVSWYDFAREIFQIAEEEISLSQPNIHKISTKDYPTKAKRPFNSALCCEHIKETFSMSPMSWKPLLIELIRNYQ